MLLHRKPRGAALTEEPAVAREPQVDDLELLDRHRPVLLWDSQEDCRALAVETMVANPGNRLTRRKRTLAGACGENGRQLTLELLCGTSADYEPRKKDRLRQAGPAVADARRLQADPQYANTIYGEVRRAPAHIVIRYWIWLYHDPGTLSGDRRHEGDWQLVEVILDAARWCPVAVTYSQEGAGERRADMEEVQWRCCASACSGPCRHPVVYIAASSHECYFERGTRITIGRTHTTDGRVDDGLPRVEPIGHWKDWPGLWGATESASPRSPGHRTDLWKPQPGRVRKTRHRKPLQARWLVRRAARFSPLTPAITSVTRDGDCVLVGWSVDRPLQRRPRRLHITLHQGEAQQVVCARTVRASGTGQARLVGGSLTPGPVVAKLCSYSWLGQRSDVAASAETHALKHRDGAGPSPRDDWTPRVWKAFHRELLIELVDRGSATIDELMSRQLRVLDLPLDRIELVAVVESARRRGLVRALDEPTRADGSPAAEIEWAATEEGRKRVPRVLHWATRRVSAVPPALAIAAASQVPWSWVQSQDPVNMAVGVLIGLNIIVVATVVVHRFVSGAGRNRRAIALQWSRHAVELPRLNRRYTVRSFSGLMFAGYGSYVVLAVASLPQAFLYIALVPAVIGQLRAQVWLFERIDRLPEPKAIREELHARATRATPVP
jgi:hypothetical protein